ncbi:hypothetical protein TruAng_003869 [Truncatella angustata]|nr:hypothetical protein TruAng_003869 [Truncatella angustata]
MASAEIRTFASNPPGRTLVSEELCNSTTTHLRTWTVSESFQQTPQVVRVSSNQIVGMVARCRVPQSPAFIATRVRCGIARQAAFAISLKQRPQEPMRLSTKRLFTSYITQPIPRDLPRQISASAITDPGYSSRCMATAASSGIGKPEVKDITMSSIRPKEKIRLEGVEQTLLPMVLFKIRDAQNPKPILGDPFAKQLLDCCDIDLEASHFSATTDDRYVTWIANRARRFDLWGQEFLNSTKEPVTVLHLGCGLDCRYFRLERRPESDVRWIDLDQLMVVDLRNRLIPGPVEGDYALRTLDVTNEGWFRDVPADRPTIIIAEGLMPYLVPEEGQKLIRDMVEYFGGGVADNGHKCQIVFDTLGSLSVKLTSYVKALRTSRAQFRWGVDEPEQLLLIHPQLKLRDRILWREYMDSHPPFFGKYGTIAASVLPSFDKNIQFWRFDF